MKVESVFGDIKVQAVEKVTLYVSSVWAERGKARKRNSAEALKTLKKTRRLPHICSTLCWAATRPTVE
jgi:hypothetical protein